MLRAPCAPLLLLAASAAAWRLPTPAEGPLTDGALSGLFDQWAAKHGKKYATPAEEARRRQVFADNMRWVVSAGFAETHGATLFADQTEEEFRKTHLRPLTPEDEAKEAADRAARGAWDGASCETCRRFPEMNMYGADPDASLDWSKKGAVVPAKDQGQCNSCYAFGASGDIEGAWFMAGNPLTSVSEQMMLDCSGHGGCSEHSGTRSELFKYVISNGGVATEQQYPYREGVGSCNSAKSSKAVKIDSYLQISNSADGEPSMFNALNKLGPFSIGISAVRMELYGGGIISGQCATKHDHAPVVVGYGASGGQQYWKVKNSWGTYWGEDGYFRIVRGVNQCGLATDALHTKVGGGPRYGCDGGKCSAGPRGHATMKKCQAVCGVPTPVPPAPTPPPPTPKPTPPITRYHCVNETAQCWEVAPGHPPGGHSTLERCQTACYSKGGYQCDAQTKQCKGVASGGAQLHVCQQQCNSPDTPVPMWTPTPGEVLYACQQQQGTCVESQMGDTKEKCEKSCVAPPVPPPAPSSGCCGGSLSTCIGLCDVNQCLQYC